MIWLFSQSVVANNQEHKNNKLFVGSKASAAKVVTIFHKALKGGDKVLAKEQLADDVTIYEGGRVERSAEEYARHHMLADMKFLSAMETELLEHQVIETGNTALSMSRSHTKGNYQGKVQDFTGMETMVLEKQDGKWKIKHIHWSR